MSLASERISRIKASAVTPDAAFVAERLRERLPERDAAILDGVVRVHLDVAFADQFQIHHGMFGEQREHVVEERDAGADGGFAGAIHIEGELNLRLARDAVDLRLPRFHAR